MFIGVESVSDRQDRKLWEKDSIEIYNRKISRDSRTKTFLSAILQSMNFRKLRKETENGEGKELVESEETEKSNELKHNVTPMFRVTSLCQRKHLDT